MLGKSGLVFYQLLSFWQTHFLVINYFSSNIFEVFAYFGKRLANLFCFDRPPREISNKRAYRTKNPCILLSSKGFLDLPLCLTNPSSSLTYFYHLVQSSFFFIHPSFHQLQFSFRPCLDGVLQPLSGFINKACAGNERFKIIFYSTRKLTNYRLQVSNIFFLDTVCCGFEPFSESSGS